MEIQVPDPTQRIAIGVATSEVQCCFIPFFLSEVSWYPMPKTPEGNHCKSCSGHQSQVGTSDSTRRGLYVATEDAKWTQSMVQLSCLLHHQEHTNDSSDLTPNLPESNSPPNGHVDGCSAFNTRCTVKPRNSENRFSAVSCKSRNTTPTCIPDAVQTALEPLNNNIL